MKSLSEKVFVLGVDGMDPRMTKKYLELGKMPHLAEFIKRGQLLQLGRIRQHMVSPVFGDKIRKS